MRENIYSYFALFNYNYCIEVVTCEMVYSLFDIDQKYYDVMVDICLNR